MIADGPFALISKGNCFVVDSAISDGEQKFI